MVKIELDKPRTMRLTLRAMARFEEETGKPIFKAMNDLHGKELMVLLWACLLHEDPDLTIEQVGDMVDAPQVEYVVEKIAEVWGVSTPKAKAKNG